jgi:hypothetical protein
MEMKTFAAPSRAEAENAAAGWWSQQIGLARISEFAAPINTGQKMPGIVDASRRR